MLWPYEEEEKILSISGHNYINWRIYGDDPNCNNPVPWFHWSLRSVITKQINMNGNVCDNINSHGNNTNNYFKNINNKKSLRKSKQGQFSITCVHS